MSTRHLKPSSRPLLDGAEPEQTGPTGQDAAADAPNAGPALSTTSTPSVSPRRKGWTVLVPIVTAAAGMMFAMSFKAASGGELRGDRDLSSLILEGNERVADKTTHFDALTKEVEALSKVAAPNDTRIADLEKQVDRLGPMAATTKITGRTITVTLDDSKTPLSQLPDNFGPDDVVVHQQDVQGVVNALWGSGAEGMMIQDQRVISTSAVRCVGNTLILQGRVYAPPYVIKAIGDPDKMARALENDPTVKIYREYVDAVGLGYDVSIGGEETFPGYTGSIDLTHAKPLR